MIAKQDRTYTRTAADLERKYNLGKLTERLDAVAMESASVPGCFYRVVSGEREWLNPPMELDTEYRTTERWLGKPVYTKIIVAGETVNHTVLRRSETVAASDGEYSQIWYVKQEETV